MGLFSSLRWRLGRALSPLEQRLLEETAALLTAPARAVFNEQVRAVRQVRRRDDGHIVFFYPGALGRPVPAGIEAFPMGEGVEIELASIRFRVPDKPTSWRARVWLANGHLSSIEFRPGAGRVWGRSDIEVLEADPVDDPTVPRPVPADDETISESSLKGWVADWVRENSVEQVLVPIPQEAITSDLERKRDALPVDYRELLMQADGLTVSAGGPTSITVYGLREMYHVPLPDDDYLTVGCVLEDDTPVGELLVKEDASDKFVYFSPYEEPMVAGSSLREAVERVLGGWRG